MENRGLLATQSFEDWLIAWQNAKNELELVGLIYCVMHTEPKLTRVKVSKKDKNGKNCGHWQSKKGTDCEGYRIRFVLLVADKKSGYSDTVRSAALKAIVSYCRKSDRLIFGNGGQREAGLRAWLWFFRGNPENSILMTELHDQMSSWLRQRILERLSKRFFEILCETSVDISLRCSCLQDLLGSILKLFDRWGWAWHCFYVSFMSTDISGSRDWCPAGPAGQAGPDEPAGPPAPARTFWKFKPLEF